MDEHIKKGGATFDSFAFGFFTTFGAWSSHSTQKVQVGLLPWLSSNNDGTNIGTIWLRLEIH
jgi:hypothetical protein